MMICISVGAAQRLPLMGGSRTGSGCMYSSRLRAVKIGLIIVRGRKGTLLYASREGIMCIIVETAD